MDGYSQVNGLSAYKRSSSPDSESEDEDISARQPTKRRKLDYVLVESCAYPRSAFSGWTAPSSPMSEGKTITELLPFLDCSESDDEYRFFKLEDFSVYLPTTNVRHAGEFETLDRLQNAHGVSELLFEGYMSCGTERRYLKDVSFQTVAIDGYDDSSILDLNGHICIQSRLAKQQNVWYQLGQPSVEYSRLYKPFKWLAEFAKHFIEYMLDHSDENVKLNHFKGRFAAWLTDRYAKKTNFESWHNYCRNLRDFRTSVAIHVGYLWKESFSLNEQSLLRHAIWTEVDPERLNAVPEQPQYEQNTVVTPYAFHCFRGMYFSSKLERRNITNPAVLQAMAEQKRKLRLTNFDQSGSDDDSIAFRQRPTFNGVVKAGDVVTVDPDENSLWQSTSSVWYAYVQRTWLKNGVEMLDVIWLYEPCQTTIMDAVYPFQNELFFSDNCGCDKEAIEASCVTGKVDVNWMLCDRARESLHGHGQVRNKGSGFFVRQKFRTVHDDDTYDFVALARSDFRCVHSICEPAGSDFEQCIREYKHGDIVLVRDHDTIRGGVLVPALLRSFDLSRQKVILQRMSFKSHVTSYPHYQNELVLLSEMFEKPAKMIIRKCHFRLFDSNTIQNGCPPPFDKGGRGDFYFMNEESLGKHDRENVNEDTDANVTKLIGMGIFAGGGNFDRGIAECGAVNFRYAVDLDKCAIHSYRANVEDSEEMHCFHGSVDDYLARAIDGESSTLIARPGQVGCLCGGSPCPGFSLLQPDKGSDTSLRNASLVASLVSFVDLYSPRYCILENVVTMAMQISSQNVFAQVVASLVGLGYQVQQFKMDAWSYGSCQSRERVFIVASAPGSKPLAPPPCTHEGPPSSKFRRSLGYTSNGLQFGMTKDQYTPYKHISPQDATEDLPSLGDGLVQICPAFASHFVPTRKTALDRAIISSIPVSPNAMSIARAAHANRLSGALIKKFKSMRKEQQGLSSRSFRRINEDHLFPTALTAAPHQCARTGQVLHWREHRTLSIMEMRRSQGFQDHEVIIGLPHRQVKIIGNSVDRSVAFALGLALRDSWTETCKTLPEQQISITRTPEKAEQRQRLLCIEDRMDVVSIGDMGSHIDKELSNVNETHDMVAITEMDDHDMEAHLDQEQLEMYENYDMIATTEEHDHIVEVKRVLDHELLQDENNFSPAPIKSSSTNDSMDTMPVMPTEITPTLQDITNNQGEEPNIASEAVERQSWTSRTHNLSPMEQQATKKSQPVISTQATTPNAVEHAQGTSQHNICNSATGSRRTSTSISPQERASIIADMRAHPGSAMRRFMDRVNSLVGYRSSD